MLGGGAYSASPTTTEDGNIQEVNYFKAVTDDDTELRKNSKSKSKKKKSNSMCRRFSDEQIKSLESVFKMENKLEPRKKLEMARQLGLHPRQVAIWFQNRRARWKSKQVEQDYTSLKADYDTLSHRFESLKKEKHALLQQLRDLCSQLKEPHDQGSKDLDMMSGSENGDINLELNGNNSSGPVVGQDMAAVYSDEDDPDRKHSVENGQGDNHDQFSDEKASNFDLLLGSLFDHSCSDWWDVWSSNS